MVDSQHIQYQEDMKAIHSEWALAALLGSIIEHPLYFLNADMFWDSKKDGRHQETSLRRKNRLINITGKQNIISQVAANWLAFMAMFHRMYPLLILTMVV